MQARIREVVEKVKALSDLEKLELVNQILVELDHPDPEIDEIWAKEARKRWQAYQAGSQETVSYADVMAKYRRS